MESDGDVSDEEENSKYLQLFNATKRVQKRNFELEENFKLINKEKREVEVSFESSLKSWEDERANFLEQIYSLQDKNASQSLCNEMTELGNKITTLQVELKAQTNLNILLTQ